MRRALSLLFVLVVVVAFAWWLAGVGGTVEIRVGDAFVGVTLPILILALLILAAVLLLLSSLIGWLRRMPARLRARKALRQRADGDAAVTRALVAIAAGTADSARIELRRARALLGDQPQVLLLTAEAERLAGREDAATEAFVALAERPDSRFLGLRGLLRQAMAREDWAEAKRLAREAEAAQPGAAWVREERAQLALRTQDWREALQLAPPEAPRAALAMAAAAQEPDPDRAAELEKQAFKADAGFAPAAVAVANRQRAAGSPRRARATLEEAWNKAPHPDLAEPLLAGIGDPAERVQAVEQLIRRNPSDPESRLLLAHATLQAGLTGRARQELEALRAAGQADRRAFLLLAEVEEAEAGDTPESHAAQARWLRDGAMAPAEPRWRCAECGTEHESWAPQCRSCHAVGQIGWSRPIVPVSAPEPA